MGKKGDYLGSVSLAAIEHIGLKQAEHDARLSEYYVGREHYLARALDFSNTTSVFVGPKGVGKSAILQMVRIERASDAERIIDISPDDLAFSTLANIEHESPLLADATRHQRLYKALWDYVLAIEIAKRHYKTNSRLKDFLRKFTKNYDEAAVSRLLDKSLDDSGQDVSLTKRILALVSEVEANFVTPYGAAGGTLKVRDPVSDSPTTSQLSLLSLVNDAVRALVNSDMIKSPYHILIDDLDLYYKGSDIQNAFIGALLLSVRRLSHAKNLKFVVSLRDYIFEAIPIEEKDKFRDQVCLVEWNDGALKQIVQERLKTVLRCSETAIWRDLFPPKAFTGIIEHTNRMPREVVSLVSSALTVAKRHGHRVVTPEDLQEGIIHFSEEQLSNLASEFAAIYPGLDLIAHRFRGKGREFDFDALRDIAFDVADCVQTGERGGVKFKWAASAFDDPATFARTLLECGLLLIKDSRKAPPRRFDPDLDQVTESSLFGIPTVFAPGLGYIR